MEEEKRGRKVGERERIGRGKGKEQEKKKRGRREEEKKRRKKGEEKKRRRKMRRRGNGKEKKKKRKERGGKVIKGNKSIFASYTATMVQLAPLGVIYYHQTHFFPNEHPSIGFQTPEAAPE